MGDDKWADSLSASSGPWLMLQLADMANMFKSILASKTGEGWRSENADIRDQAFSQIIGLNKTTWQVVW